MPPIPHRSTIAVTGAAGYIGGWVVRRALEHGYRVRACVRDTEDMAKTGFLRQMPAFASGRLTLHAADLDNPGCFDEIFAGCQGVAHVSHVSTYDDQDYVRRTCDHIINSVDNSGTVNRVIVTSSVAAVIDESDMQELARRPVLYEGRFPDETNPRRTTDRGKGYSMGKVVAERAFADAADEHGRWDAITVCPADNVGPIQSPHQATTGWQGRIGGMLTGEYFQTAAYRPWMTVDVRDCADAHVLLLSSDRVDNGERYIAWSTDARDIEDICASIDELLPELRHDAPGVTDPFPERIQAREGELRGIWAGTELRNDRICDATGIEFRTLDESIIDTVESLISVGGLQVRRRED
jgi:dihydroflavonol-4-reductase